MSSPKVRLYARPVLDDGTRPFLDPVYSANHKLKAGYAVHQGRAQRFETVSYYLRYLRDGKRIWEPLGSDASLVLDALRKRQALLDAIAVGAIEESTPAPESKRRTVIQPVTKTTEESSSVERHPLVSSKDVYLAEVEDHKAPKTHVAYREALERFIAQIPLREYMEDVTRADVLAYLKWEKEIEKNSARTMHNRACFLRTFFRHFGLVFPLANKDLPKYTTKKVRSYSPDQIQAMLAHADQDEAELLQFLLCTGAREQEAQYACWTDVDLERKRYTFTEHLDLGFRPKDREEGTIPIPEILVRILRARRKRYPLARLIFPGPNSHPNGHMLRIVKALALRAGVNCGHCLNKKGQSCAEHPVCKHVLLHKWRKAFASQLSRNNVPPRTLMRYLRHSDLETTLKYIADEDDEQLRATVDRTFAGFGAEVTR